MQSVKTRQYVLLLAVVTLSFTVFINSLSNEFVWDDKYEILNNAWIRDPGHIPDILFSQSLGWLKPAQSSTKYSPLKLLVRLIQFQISGTDPWLYQFTNVLVHAMSTVMVFYIASGIFLRFYDRGSLAFPAAAAALFAVHPIHTEPVNWAIGLSELSMTFFCLLSFYLHMKADEGSIKKNALAGLFLFIALLFKITALFFIPVFIAYDYTMKTRRSADQSGTLSTKTILSGYAPLALAVAGFFILYSFVTLGEKDPAKMNHIRLDTYNLLLNIPSLFAEYIKKLVLPLGLNALYVFHPVSSVTHIRFLIPMIFFTFFVLLLIISPRRYPVLFLCLVWIAAPLLPCLYLPATGYSYYVFAERYLYLPSAGYVIAVAILAYLLLRRMPLRRVTVFLSVFILAIVICFSILTFRRNDVWKDDYSLWSDTVIKSPDSDIAHNNLGVEYEKRGLPDEALREYEKAISLNPFYSDALENRFRVMRARNSLL